MSWTRLAGLAFLLALASGAASGRASTPSPIVFAADRAPTVTGEVYRLDPLPGARDTVEESKDVRRVRVGPFDGLAQ